MGGKRASLVGALYRLSGGKGMARMGWRPVNIRGPGSAVPDEAPPSRFGAVVWFCG